MGEFLHFTISVSGSNQGEWDVLGM